MFSCFLSPARISKVAGKRSCGLYVLMANAHTKAPPQRNLNSKRTGGSFRNGFSPISVEWPIYILMLKFNQIIAISRNKHFTNDMSPIHLLAKLSAATDSDVYKMKTPCGLMQYMLFFSRQYLVLQLQDSTFMGAVKMHAKVFHLGWRNYLDIRRVGNGFFCC